MQGNLRFSLKLHKYKEEIVMIIKKMLKNMSLKCRERKKDITCSYYKYK